MVFCFFVSCLLFCYMVFGVVFNVFVGYSVSNWMVLFIICSYGMDMGELGIWFVMLMGVGGVIGVFGGGFLVECLVKCDVCWYMWLLMLIGIICLFFMVVMYFVDSGYVVLFCGVILSMFFNVYFGNILVMSYGFVGLCMCVFVLVILFFIFNLIGLGFGFFLVGRLSDVLVSEYGVELLCLVMFYLLFVVMMWLVLYFFLVFRMLKEDLVVVLD